MNKFRKLAASIAAITTALSLSVGTLAVTANEVKKAIDTKPAYTLAEKQFIESYENSDESKAAKFLIDNGYTLSESKKMVEDYIDGCNKLKGQSESNRDTPSFYNSTNLSKNQHYGVVFMNTSTTGGHYFDSSLQYGGSGLTGIPSTASLHTWDNNNINYSYITLNTNPAVIKGTLTTYTAPTNPIALFDLPFSVYSTTTNELAVKNSFTFSLGSTSTPCEYYTYVKGDVNHDGKVNSIDYSMIFAINIGTMSEYDLPDSYTDVSASVALRINRMAGDIDKNGNIELAELNWISNHSNWDN